jgi:hypothetical protein
MTDGIPKPISGAAKALVLSLEALIAERRKGPPAANVGDLNAIWQNKPLTVSDELRKQLAHEPKVESE